MGRAALPVGHHLGRPGRRGVQRRRRPDHGREQPRVPDRGHLRAGRRRPALPASPRRGSRRRGGAGAGDAAARQGRARRRLPRHHLRGGDLAAARRTGRIPALPRQRLLRRRLAPDGHLRRRPGAGHGPRRLRHRARQSGLREHLADHAGGLPVHPAGCGRAGVPRRRHRQRAPGQCDRRGVRWRCGDRLGARHHRVENNHVHHVGRDYHGSPAILLSGTRDTVVAHNQVNDVPHVGIVVYEGHGAQVLNNLVHDTMQVLADGGGIYVSGNQGSSHASGALIRGNVVRDTITPTISASTPTTAPPGSPSRATSSTGPTRRWC
ncbi:right-handed parallel beta-helix repeat-containing protein [Streptosporangium lutulentum]